MKIEVQTLGLIKANCYLVSTEHAFVIIDPGFVSEAVEAYADQNRGKTGAVLLTHAHFDHIGGAVSLREKFGLPIYISETDAPVLLDPKSTLSDRFHAHVLPFEADYRLHDGEEFSVGDIAVRILFTPGHTPGSAVFWINGSLFSGDTLFYRAVGRTDHVGGNDLRIAESVRGLYSLAEETTVYPGHGQPTTIGEEKKYNPVVRGEEAD